MKKIINAYIFAYLCALIKINFPCGLVVPQVPLGQWEQWGIRGENYG